LLGNRANTGQALKEGVPKLPVLYRVEAQNRKNQAQAKAS
jgi:hypothetical protein